MRLGLRGNADGSCRFGTATEVSRGLSGGSEKRQQLKYPVDYQVDQKKGVLQVTLQRTPDIKTQTLLGSMETVLYQLAEQCPQDVRIREHGGEMNV